MWDSIIKCFKKGSGTKGCTMVKLVDLYKRVPPNQRKQFQQFAKKNEEYKIRLRKYPDQMPTIDWAFYEQNVRGEMVGWVKEFQNKYDKLDSVFANRHSLIDHSKYFGEVTEQAKEVEMEIKKFKEESDERICRLQLKMDQLKAMKPYTEMTMEEFCYAHPDEAPDFINRPTFWPHTPEEQKPGPPDVVIVHDEEPKGPDASGDKKKAKPDSSKPPPKAPPTGSAPAGGKSEAPANAKKDAKDTKDSKEEKTSPSKDEGKTEKLSDAKAEIKQHTESQAVETASQLATKGVELAKDLVARAVILFQSVVQKVGEKRKETAAKAQKVQLVSNQNKAVQGKLKPDDGEDSFLVREGSSDICNKTIIRGDDVGKADVKPHHVDLEIEGDSDAKSDDEKVCKRTSKCEDSDKDEKICKRKTECEEEEDECPFDKKKTVNAIACSQPEKKSPCDKDPKNELPAKPLVLSDKSEIIKHLDNENFSATPVLEIAGLSIARKFSNETPNPIGPNPLSPPPRLNNEKSEVVHCVAATQIVSTQSQQATVGANNDAASGQGKSGSANAEEMAEVIFKMAANAASLLSEAKKMIENAKLEKGNDIKSVYNDAEKKVTSALDQAQKALSAAKQLTEEAGIDALAVTAMIKKHTVLATLLIDRAATMKNEIEKLLTGLKKN